MFEVSHIRIQRRSAPIFENRLKGLKTLLEIYALNRYTAGHLEFTRRGSL